MGVAVCINRANYLVRFFFFEGKEGGGVGWRLCVLIARLVYDRL